MRPTSQMPSLDSKRQELGKEQGFNDATLKKARELDAGNERVCTCFVSRLMATCQSVLRLQGNDSSMNTYLLHIVPTGDVTDDVALLSKHRLWGLAVEREPALGNADRLLPVHPVVVTHTHTNTQLTCHHTNNQTLKNLLHTQMIVMVITFSPWSRYQAVQLEVNIDDCRVLFLSHWCGSEVCFVALCAKLLLYYRTSGLLMLVLIMFILLATVLLCSVIFNTNALGRAHTLPPHKAEQSYTLLSSSYCRDMITQVIYLSWNKSARNFYGFFPGSGTIPPASLVEIRVRS